ncbi:metalloregulator ArsR/SmtB family transcription factor [Rathayibacter sp. VKM Ac-2803]|uniref:ArsR/SmtB family transcription factor n=1 Tax=unclassified Rathayibacter TaxID=2609250 RepID=UPI0013581212|nr:MULTISPECIES: metalloregulator ArsR/SmtB family transcription factor [unclassified Rathayibacter]MWV49017.1 metalloregulator ArsR/SmtB family transcription factor [Rathayibacter sp. VKM Ac-2803]MWV58491.1 metalloregulator ArsR/SmtB family transcription factor [Rathayibacter sp. VKM Ac-2754]
MADIFAVIADGTRRDILSILLEQREAGDVGVGGISVSRIVARLELSQPTVSKHLKVLREAGLVTVRESGQHRYYALQYSPLEEVEDWLLPFLSTEEVDAGPVLLDAPTAARAESLGRALADRTHQVSTVVQDIQRGVSEGATKVAEALRIRK